MVSTYRVLMPFMLCPIGRLLVLIWESAKSILSWLPYTRVMARGSGALRCKGVSGAMRRHVSVVMQALPRHLKLCFLVGQVAWWILYYIAAGSTCATQPTWWLGPSAYTAGLWVLVYAINVYHR